MAVIKYHKLPVGMIALLRLTGRFYEWVNSDVLFMQVVYLKIAMKCPKLLTLNYKMSKDN